MKYVLANWKMYPTVDEALALLSDIQAGLLDRARSGVTLPSVIICPPFVSLLPLRDVADQRVVRLGAQNCHWEPEGPYTGEVSPRMLRGLVDYAMVGHSERRSGGETEEQIARKVAAVVEAELVPILFVGEDTPDDDAIQQTEDRLRRGLSRVDVATRRVLVVYEPSWAIGAEEAAPTEHVNAVVDRIKAVLRQLGTTAPAVIYGGTVAEQNIDELAQLEVLDGVGATRASLEAPTFLSIVDRLHEGPDPRAVHVLH
jgi:triosephosphate isomerase